MKRRISFHVRFRVEVVIITALATITIKEQSTVSSLQAFQDIKWNIFHVPLHPYSLL